MPWKEKSGTEKKISENPGGLLSCNLNSESSDSLFLFLGAEVGLKDFIARLVKLREGGSTIQILYLWFVDTNADRYDGYSSSSSNSDSKETVLTEQHKGAVRSIR